MLKKNPKNRPDSTVSKVLHSEKARPNNLDTEDHWSAAVTQEHCSKQKRERKPKKTPLTVVHFVPSLLDGLELTVNVILARVHTVHQRLALMLKLVHSV